MPATRILAIDLETYCDLDIKKVGGYKYAENCEILLFGYAYDDDPVQVIDVARGEAIPPDVLTDLEEPEILKTAYNAQFERTVLSHYLDKIGRRNMESQGFLSPEQWQCSMVLGMTLGLPGSLAELSAVFGLGEDKGKMSIGKSLIWYFCKPCKATKSNGGRVRNMPADDLEKWNTFIEYNRRDVEVERLLRKKMWPWLPGKEEKKLWDLDQRINDRGVYIDSTLVNNAIQIDYWHQQELAARAKELTGLPNPGSGAQLKQWIQEKEGFFPESLTKTTIPEIREQAKCDEVKEMLDLKLLMSRTSIKKYEAMRNACCTDGRVHGLLQFYGAGRTGRWCLTGDHEILTSDGWVRMDNWKGGEIACWSPATEYISFQSAKALEFDYSGEMYVIESQRCSQMSTPDHKMAYLDKSGLWGSDTVENLSKTRFTIPFNGQRLVDARGNDIALRVIIMTQADGHYTKESLRFHFKKKRKIERCKMLLRRAGIVYGIRSNKDSSAVIDIKRRDMPIWLRLFRDKVFGTWILNESADTFFDELENWDACRCGPNSIQYVSTVKQNADVIQALAHMSRRAASIITKVRNREKWADAYAVNIWLTPGKGNAIRREHVSTQNYDGKVYCAETRTGFFMVRRNGKVWITGNSGRLVQVQNLPRCYMEDLDDARWMLHTGDREVLEAFYDDVPDVLSQLIRTAFTAEPCSNRLLDADFSAIEARVIAWLADEGWRQQVFRENGDIYCASASAMFKVPVVKHGENGELRQKGKIAELALGYQGGVGALKAMGADKMGLSDEELADIVERWRKASPRIVRLWYEVQDAAMKAINDRTAVTIRHGIKFICERGLLFIQLPSGRRIAYAKPRIGENRFGGASITYEGMDQIKRKWVRLETYGGKLVENIVQATARDCLGYAMLALDKAGYPIVMHIHDEVVMDVPNEMGSLDDICRIMSEPIPWAPGLILNADGFESPYFKKD